MVYDIVPFACVCCIHNPFSWKGFQSRLLANLCWNEQSTITHVLSNRRKRSLCSGGVQEELRFLNERLRS